MNAHAVVFYVFAAITVGSAAVVVLARSLIYNAFALLFTFFGVAGLYVLLGADFLAATQLLVYVGGILVLLLFGVMLTHKLYDLELRSEVVQFVPGAIIAAGFFVLLSYPGIPRPSAWPFEAWPFAGRGLIFGTQWASAGERLPAPTAAQIGELFMSRYLLPFEAASILLLVALIGAAMIVRRRKDA
jgi:NADH-quinone oxidoreductase subunit J